MAKRKPKEKKVHRVYCTYFPNGDYYIGYSGKPQRLYEKYYGSSKYVLQYEGELNRNSTSTSGHFIWIDEFKGFI